LSKQYSSTRFIEINAHSLFRSVLFIAELFREILFASCPVLCSCICFALFSKWFSESGKLVQKLFESIKDQLKDEKQLICLLLDEVESLAASRSHSSASEPHDAVRVR
jgi:hypothetical protein